eukprot:GHVP01045262.1.p1 GENE.GHVP01045262.1~~GHVP01045262.1.p1  ORF type:complete len:307 (-),score=49.42 GHVP01045262.1:545-1465(-)
MRRAAEKEMEILRCLKEPTDDQSEKRRDDGRHIIQLLRSFEHRGHLCLVFEWMWGNLRVALKRYGGGSHSGLTPSAMHSYTKQLFKALRHLKRHGVLHADLKPDNVLVSEKFNILKVCDLGSATNSSDNEITSYLVSRFYRAPEIILGAKYDSQIDMWSAGCTLFELATGDVMFPGRTNNDMLKKIQDSRGKISVKNVKAGVFSSNHFDSNFVFLHKEKDKMTQKDVIRRITDFKPEVIGSLLEKKCNFASDNLVQKAHIQKKCKQLGDLLERCLALDASKRLTPDDALRHPYCREAFDLVASSER